MLTNFSQTDKISDFSLHECMQISEYFKQTQEKCASWHRVMAKKELTFIYYYEGAKLDFNLLSAEDEYFGILMKYCLTN